MIQRYTTAKQQRQVRTRKRLAARGSRPRLSVFRSSQHIYAQIIDDQQGKSLVAASDRDLAGDKEMTKQQKAVAVGELLAQRAKKAKITTVMFDRGSYAFHGRVRALAEAARKGGLTF